MQIKEILIPIQIPYAEFVCNFIFKKEENLTYLESFIVALIYAAHKKEISVSSNLSDTIIKTYKLDERYHKLLASIMNELRKKDVITYDSSIDFKDIFVGDIKLDKHVIHSLDNNKLKGFTLKDRQEKQKVYLNVFLKEENNSAFIMNKKPESNKMNLLKYTETINSEEYYKERVEKFGNSIEDKNDAEIFQKCQYQNRDDIKVSANIIWFQDEFNFKLNNRILSALDERTSILIDVYFEKIGFDNLKESIESYLSFKDVDRFKISQNGTIINKELYQKYLLQLNDNFKLTNIEGFVIDNQSTFILRKTKVINQLVKTDSSHTENIEFYQATLENYNFEDYLKILIEKIKNKEDVFNYYNTLSNDHKINIIKQIDLKCFYEAFNEQNFIEMIKLDKKNDSIFKEQLSKFIFPEKIIIKLINIYNLKYQKEEVMHFKGSRIESNINSIWNIMNKISPTISYEELKSCIDKINVIKLNLKEVNLIEFDIQFDIQKEILKKKKMEDIEKIKMNISELSRDIRIEFESPSGFKLPLEKGKNKNSNMVSLIRNSNHNNDEKKILEDIWKFNNQFHHYQEISKNSKAQNRDPLIIQENLTKLSKNLENAKKIFKNKGR